MAKETPFFKFDTASWLGGSIQFTSLECKGLFIDLCALYWESEKPIKIDTKFKVRVRCDEVTLSDLIVTLSDLEIIHNSELGITIPFLDKLKIEREKFLEKCSKGGKKSRVLQGKSSNKKEERRKKKVESRDKNTISWIDEANPNYLDYCQRFFNMLNDNGKIKSNTNWKTKKWYDAIRLLVEQDGIKMEQLENALVFLNKHICEEYCPQCWSTESLRKKWISLNDYYKRKSNKTVVNPGQPQPGKVYH